MQVIWHMVLLDLKPLAEGESDPGTHCVHWVLDRVLFSEPGLCSLCHKTWDKLVQTCVEENILSYCQFLYGYKYLIHGALLGCPHCHGTKSDHLVPFLSKVILSLLTDKSVGQPEDAPREGETFDLSRCIGALASTYPNHYCGVLTEWKESVSNVNGDAILLITPKVRYHNSACTEGCNEEFRANASELMRQELV